MLSFLLQIVISNNTLSNITSIYEIFRTIDPEPKMQQAMILFENIGVTAFIFLFEHFFHARGLPVLFTSSPTAGHKLNYWLFQRISPQTKQTASSKMV